MKRFAALLLIALPVFAQNGVPQAVAQFEERVAKAPKPVAIEFRLRAAQALKERYPEHSRKLLNLAVNDLHGAAWVAANGSVQQALKELSADPVPVNVDMSRLVAPAPELSKRIGTMRSLPTDADRARLVLEVTPQIRALPAGGVKLRLIRGLASVSTEGDLGKPALSAVATTLADAMREGYPQMIAAKEPWSYGDGYLELASLVRYESIEVPGSDPALEAAAALLALRERVQQEAGFTLTALDGKTYSLAGLKGRIVLLNFWATWCPPCRKEMPDMDKLYRKYEGKGLTVLAVSDEKRETVEGFLAKNPYSFPVLLDLDRKVHSAFGVEGIPKSFLFDREGRIAAQAIDMRTEGQFMELLKRAGL